MLLEFRAKNYKSFVDEFCFSMTPAPKQKGLDYSVLYARMGSKTYKGLCCGVVYGPNASGKTNLIGAMDTFKNIILRGNVRNTEPSSMNLAAASLDLIPNCQSQAEPTKFYIHFITSGLVIEYSLIVDLGKFMEENYARRILEEKLVVNEKQVFQRGDTLEVDIPRIIKPYINKNAKKNEQIQNIAEGSLSDTELFLTNGFKTIFAQELVKIIIDWLNDKFIVIYHSESLRVSRRMTDLKSNTVFVEKTLTEAAKAFGITANALGYRKADDGEESILLSIIQGAKAIPAELFESYGTIRFITEFPLIIYALLKGCTLIMDEFDASIHPMALMNIINIFHNDELNKKNAQLIFNTHNPIFLDASLLRRDEIKFVERDDSTGRSSLYALSDFRTAAGYRKGEDYMNNYFVSRYGAIKDIDFQPILAKIINDTGVFE